MAGVMMKLACVVVMCVALVGAPLAEAITCGQVTSSVAPCLGYLQKGGNPSPGCCNGVKSLVAAARTTADKQTVCNCLKTTAGQIPGYNDANAQAIPAKCRVNVPYKLSTSTNCASIKF
ncbi:non-specific lipid-transfer protein 1-like [Prosopis cineraria]|uniref:non-specific lipid-transfer protein 1-like n=1 Tax=Prosopis cineraria TaxID=364024 RepID=UPI0024108134|nr:non-specific lipid-transfer protein 1-like [Prosopis cineraria]